MKCVLIAAARGVLESYKGYIVVAGTEEGADTAIICKATSLKQMFGKDVNKRLEVAEINGNAQEKEVVGIKSVHLKSLGFGLRQNRSHH